MSKKTILITTLLVSFFVISCKKEVEPPETNSTQTTEVNKIDPVVKPVSTTESSGTPPKLNPPHGEPFHRCEIAVGAPLDGTPAPNTPNAPPKEEPKSFFKALQTENQTQEVTKGEKPKLNPAHGQPYHICEIAVGAPLP